RFPDGVLWAQCGSGAPPAITLQQWGAALGISQSDLDRLSSDAALLSGMIHSVLQDRAALIVLEDVSSAEDARRMLLGGSRCCHVVSSPFADAALRLTPDHHFQIPPLTPEQSRALLEHIAPEIARHDSLFDQLVAWSSGLPLALELLGQYLGRALRSGQPRRIEAAIAQLLETRSRLELLSARAEAGLSGLSKVIRATIAQLPPEQQHALNRLVALPPAPAAFDEATMLAMIQGSVIHLDALVDRGMVQCANGAYSIHPVLRDVVLADPSAANEHRAGQVQLAQLAQSLVETGDGLNQLSQSDQALLLAGAQAAVELGLSEAACALSLRLLPSLLIRGWLQLADALLTTAQARPNSAADSIRLKAYHARVLTRLGRMQDARACADQAAAMAEKAYPALLPHALVAQAWARSAGGDPIGALDSCARAETFDIPEPRLALELKRVEGAALVNSGRYAEARTIFQEALELARDLRASEEEAMIAIALGTVGRQQRRYDEAETWFTHGLGLARSLSASEPAVLALTGLGIIANERNQRQRAAAYFAEAEPLALRLGLPWPLLQLRHAQGVLYMRLKQWAQAERMLREALQVAQSIQWHLWVSNVSIELGECLLATGQLDEANHVCAAALARAREGGHNDLAALLRYVLARAARERGDIETARHLAQLAAAQLQSSGHYRADEVAAWLAGLGGDVETAPVDL
ncbi:MAG: tetratricopeptide repeat protein, partial [Thermoflexales bacterium]